MNVFWKVEIKEQGGKLYCITYIQNVTVGWKNNVHCLYHKVILSGLIYVRKTHFMHSPIFQISPVGWLLIQPKHLVFIWAYYLKPNIALLAKPIALQFPVPEIRVPNLSEETPSL